MASRDAGVAVLYPSDAGTRPRIGAGPPDRAAQERAQRLWRRLGWARPAGTAAAGVAALAFVIAPTHPVSVVLYAVGVTGVTGALAWSRLGGARLRREDAAAGVPIPAGVAEDALENDLRLCCLDEEVAFWRRVPGATELRRRLQREDDEFRAAVRALRTAWLRGDDDGWHRAGRRAVDLRDGLGEVSAGIARLPYRTRRGPSD